MTRIFLTILALNVLTGCSSISTISNVFKPNESHQKALCQNMIDEEQKACLEHADSVYNGDRKRVDR